MLDTKSALPLIRMAQAACPSQHEFKRARSENLAAILTAIDSGMKVDSLKKVLSEHPNLSAMAWSAQEAMISAYTRFSELEKALDAIEVKLDPKAAEKKSDLSEALDLGEG